MRPRRVRATRSRRTLRDLRGQEGNSRQVHSPGSLRNRSQFASGCERSGKFVPGMHNHICDNPMVVQICETGEGPTVLRAVSTLCQLSRMEFCDEASQYTFD